MKALKRFGQNFLIDKNIINKIVNQINFNKDDNILEIGPGQGALTEYLIQHNNYSAVELDPRMVDELKQKYPHIKIYNEDFLKFDLPVKQGIESNFYIFGNIPYNITSPILLKLCSDYNQITEAIVMIQSEAAERITSPFGTKDYNASNIIINSFCDVELLFNVPRNAFLPRPNVDSKVIRMKFIKDNRDKSYFNLFSDIVKSAFLSRRKVLRNSSLIKKYGFANFESLDKFLSKRADELTPADYHLITESIHRKQV